MVRVGEMERQITDEDRVKALTHALAKANAQCGIVIDRGLSLVEYAERILHAALRQPIEPDLYQLMWFIS